MRTHPAIDWHCFRQSPYNSAMQNSLILPIRQNFSAKGLLRGDVVVTGSAATTKTGITG